jgi:hypothetical protein
MAAHSWQREGRPEVEHPAQHTRRRLDCLEASLAMMAGGFCAHDKKAAAAALKREFPLAVAGLAHLPASDRHSALNILFRARMALGG